MNTQTHPPGPTGRFFGLSLARDFIDGAATASLTLFEVAHFQESVAIELRSSDVV